jgi:hypothetical protein
MHVCVGGGRSGGGVGAARKAVLSLRTRAANKGHEQVLC